MQRRSSIPVQILFWLRPDRFPYGGEASQILSQFRPRLLRLRSRIPSSSDAALLFNAVVGSGTDRQTSPGTAAAPLSKRDTSCQVLLWLPRCQFGSRFARLEYRACLGVCSSTPPSKNRASSRPCTGARLRPIRGVHGKFPRYGVPNPIFFALIVQSRSVFVLFFLYCRLLVRSSRWRSFLFQHWMCENKFYAFLAAFLFSLFLLSMNIFLLCFSWLINVQAFKKLALSADKLSEVVSEEVPGTLSSLKLSGLEINDLTSQLNNLKYAYCVICCVL